MERPEARDGEAEDGEVGDDVEDGAGDEHGAELDAMDFDHGVPEERQRHALHQQASDLRNGIGYDDRRDDPRASRKGFLGEDAVQKQER